MLKSYLKWPWLVSVPLLLGGLGCSLFFVGTDSVLITPAVICLLLFAGIAIGPGFVKGWAIPQTNTFFFVMCFWLWLVLSLAWSTTPYVSTMFTIIISILPGVFMVSILSQQREEWVKIHAGALWLLLVGFAVWANIQFFFLFDKMGPRIHHPMLDPNSLAGLLNIAIAPAVGIMFIARGRAWQVLSAVCAVLLYAALVETQSRAGYATCIGSVLVLLPFLIWRNPEGVPWKKLAVLLVAGVAVPYLLSHAKGADTLENLVGDSMVESFTQKRSMEDRFYLWESTWRMIKDHFFLGTGLASFFFYYPRYRQPLDRSDGFFAHMDPLQYWAEIGVLAPVLFYGVLICVLLRTVRAMRTAPREDMSARIGVIAPFCGMLALTAHSHLNYHLYMPGLLLPLSVMLAYWYVATEQVLGDGSKRWMLALSGKKRMAVIGGVLVVALLASGWLVRVSAAGWMIGKVQEAAASGANDLAQERMKIASVIAPGSYTRYYEYEARLRLTILSANAKTMKKEDVRAMYDEALHYLELAEISNPAFTAIWDLRARLYFAVNGVIISDGEALAVKELTRVVKANPLSADSRVALAQIYRGKGELRKAEQVLEQGLSWPRQKGRTDLQFLLTLANIKNQLGEKEDAAVYIREAQKRARQYGMTIQQQ